MINYREAHSIKEFDREQWDAMAGNVVAMTYGWQCVMETGWQNKTPCYLWIEDERGPLAAIITQLNEDFGSHGALGWFHSHLNAVISPPFSGIGTGVLLRPGESFEIMRPHLDRILREFSRRHRRPLTTIANVTDETRALWESMSFHPSPRPDLMVMKVPDTYDAYLAGLNSKDRSELRRIRRHAQESGLEITFERGPLAGEGEAIYPLFCEVYAKHGTSRESMPFSPQFFHLLEQETPGQAFLIKGYINGVLEGVSLCLRHNDSLWWPMAGLHYEVARPHYLYFLLIDEMVQWSIENGIRFIDGGLTNERQKARHGFVRQPRWYCYRSNVLAVNRFIAWALPLARRLVKDDGL
ncbi:MAG: GNAT family N-acetyltransferase [Anaerolineae bacterium]|nr:GNAT family N-acetyltransferase [Anaerolineae bacterium]